MLDVILKRFEQPDELRQFEKGKFELIHIADMTIGRATYSPGWKWSEHVGRSIGKKSCDVGACRHRSLRASDCCHGRWQSNPDESG